MRAINTPVVVQRLRFFQIANRVVDPVLLLVEQGGIKPRRRVVGIQFFRPLKFLGGARVIARIRVSLAQITPQHGALRFQRRGHQQVFASVPGIAAADAAKTASQPGVAERGVHGQRLVEPADGLAGAVLRREQKSLQRERLGVARRQRQAFVQRFERGVGAAETEFQFRHAFPGKTEIRRVGRGLPRRMPARPAMKHPGTARDCS